MAKKQVTKHVLRLTVSGVKGDVKLVYGNKEKADEAFKHVQFCVRNPNGAISIEGSGGTFVAPRKAIRFASLKEEKVDANVDAAKP